MGVGGAGTDTLWRLGAPSVRRRRLCARAYLVDLDVGAYPRHQKDCCRGGAVMRGRAGEGDAERWVAAPSKSERRGRARAKKRGQDLPCTRSLRRGAEARADGLGMRGAQRRHPPTHPPTRGAEQSGRAACSPLSRGTCQGAIGPRSRDAVTLLHGHRGGGGGAESGARGEHCFTLMRSAAGRVSLMGFTL